MYPNCRSVFPLRKPVIKGMCKSSSNFENFDKVQYVYLDFSLRTKYCTQYKSKILSRTKTQIVGKDLRSNITLTSHILLYV